ncbi:ArsR/SmtB family transcription factor [Acinetobacter sp. WZC-1]|uniref:ArsR/SmtB family transcription factor n=1 Tax=Acinetobacter sp. WZC-1 TaxID=3459034 RepID=UPI00403D9762
MDSSELENVSALFRALSDQGRLSLVMLLESGEKSVGELTEASGDKLVNVSARLRDLYHARLVSKRREGRNIYYSLSDKHVTEIIHNACEHISEC